MRATNLVPRVGGLVSRPRWANNLARNASGNVQKAWPTAACNRGCGWPSARATKPGGLSLEILEAAPTQSSG
eukprot:9681002-Lingulodinium_polyedra.AAC.1